MPFSRFFLFVNMVCVLLAGPTSVIAAKKKPEPATTGGYKGAIVLDASSGKVLFEENADLQNPPASMTKLMTFAILKERMNAGSLTPDTEVTVTAADSKIGGTQVWLKEGEKFSVEELLYAMIIQSANDAAYALARTAAGSADAFVELMNAKARELGMTHTVFRTPHGLPPSNRNIAEGDLTTPRDFAILSLYLVQKTDILKYASVKSRQFGRPQRVQPVAMNNHNHLLGKVSGVDGLKTGYTVGAGFCIAITAERNGRRIVSVTMGGTTSKARDLRMTELIERGFAAMPPPQTIRATSEPITNSPLKPAPLSSSEKSNASPSRATSTDEPLIKLPAVKR